MTLIDRLLLKLRLRRESGMHQYQLDDQLHALIEEMALKEKRPEQEITTRLLESALVQHSTSQELWNRWQSLSRREQEVTAFTCLGYTNRQIAAKLGVAPSTIKTHVGNVLAKFNLHAKTELIIALREWDFSAWDQAGKK
jgi:DNA-binding NarL/FixJ family response regulator